MSNIIISKKNEVYLHIEAEPHVCQELNDLFTFEVPGAKFMPQYRNKYWDGKIRLFSLTKNELYVGLLDKLISFVDSSNYTYEFKNNKFYGLPFEVNDNISYEGVSNYITSISSHKPRDYQIESVYDALKNNRRLLISPTASGKSLMIYSITRYYTEKGLSTLIVVPTTSLVEQMYKDFSSYGWKSEDYCHIIYSGKEKYDINHPVVITTWQSIYKEPLNWFDRFRVVIGDEAHLFKSKSLVDIMTKLLDCKHRFGLTGTLDGTQTHKWVLEGLFGPSYKVIQTKELIEKGHLSNLNIKILLLKHNGIKFDNYEQEVQFIIGNDRRNSFIKNLTLDLKGNTLVLFSRVDSHGRVLYDLINNFKDKERKVFFVYGGVDVKEREEVRRIVEEEQNAIIIASYGTFSTGINIKNLHNVVFASPSKSRIRNLQSIGRVLRKGRDKVEAVLYDIADDISFKSSKNYTLNHLIERIKIYNEESFNYSIINVNLKL